MLRIHMNQDLKVAEIWLSKAESDDPEIEKKLNPIYKKCKAHKYMAVLYRSGKESLFETTKDLIIHNYNNCVNPQQIWKQFDSDMGRS